MNNLKIVFFSLYLFVLSNCFAQNLKFAKSASFDEFVANFPFVNLPYIESQEVWNNRTGSDYSDRFSKFDTTLAFRYLKIPLHERDDRKHCRFFYVAHLPSPDSLVFLIHLEDAPIGGTFATYYLSTFSSDGNLISNSIFAMSRGDLGDYEIVESTINKDYTISQTYKHYYPEENNQGIEISQVIEHREKKIVDRKSVV